MTSSVFTDKVADKFIRESSASMQAKLDDLAVKRLRCNTDVSANMVTTKTSSVDERVREKNVVIFGIPESRDSSE